MSPYPSIEEREKIITQRKQLAQEIIHCLVIEDEKKQRKEMNRLTRQYGEAAIERELRFLNERFTISPDPDQDEARVYYAYVDYYRRFGGQRRLLTPEEFSDLNLEYGKLFVRQEVEQSLNETEQKRLAHLSDLMLKEAPFWDDLVPEDPPPELPELPPLPVVSSNLGDMLDEPVCPRDGFPMVRINGKLQCAVEYIDRCVGGETVVDVVQRGKTTHYVFESGHQLPLLCACCGQGLSVPDLDAERKQVVDRRLEAMSMAPETDKNGRVYNQLVLEFSKKGTFSKGILVPVSFEVAANMRHPTGCPYRKNVASSSKKKKSRRKGRRKRK